MTILACAVIFLSLLSGGSTLHSRWKVRENRADIDALRDLSGIVSRSRIQGLFGTPDQNGFYKVPLEKILRVRQLPHVILDDHYFDLLCTFLGLTALLYDSLSWLVFPALVYIVAGWVHALALIYQNRSELAREWRE